jgi:tetratricopeptide (TPR) repeat protein
LWQLDEQRGLEHAGRLLELSRAQARVRGEGLALELIAIAAMQRGDFDEARTLFEQALPLMRDAGDPWLISVVLNNLGDTELNAGNFERAIALFEESLQLGELRGNIGRRARELQNLGSAQLALGDRSGARARFEEALDAARALGLREIYVYGLLGLAAACVVDDPKRAAHLQGVSDAIAEELGTSVQPFEANMRENTLAGVKAAGMEDVYRNALLEVRSLGVEHAVASAVAPPVSQTAEA